MSDTTARTPLVPGLSAERSIVVTPADTAEAYGSGGVAVFATPAMIALMEAAAAAAVAPALAPGETTVGTAVNIQHTAATPVGMRVTARAVLTAVEGRRLEFRVEARDERESIGAGSHVRAVVSLDRFLTRVNGKRGESGPDRRPSF